MNGTACTPAFRQLLQPSPVIGHQCLFLRPAPALDLHLRSQGLLASREILRKAQVNRAFVMRITTGNRTSLVLGHAFFKIVGVTRVIRAISATQNIDVESHGTW